MVGVAVYGGLSCLCLGLPPNVRAAAPEEVLFFDARADQTGTTNGGTLIWSLSTNSARWWYPNVKMSTVSPNGKLVAYILGSDLLLTDVQGNNPKLLSRQAAGPAWSPLGDRIAFAFGGDQVRIINLDGAVIQTFPNASAERPTWSPDGKKIAFTGAVDVPEIGCELFEQTEVPCPRTQGMATVFTINLETGQRTQLFAPSYESVEGERWTDSRSGTVFTPIVTTQRHLKSPQWSPDGTFIAAELRVLRQDTRPAPDSGLVPRRLSTVEANIVLLPSNGGSFTRVTTDFNPPPFPPSTLLQNFSAAWSEDGRLFYSRSRGASAPEQAQGIFVIPPGGGGSTRVNGYVASSLQWVRLNQSGVELEIVLEKNQVKVGQRVQASVRVTSRENTPQIITFSDPMLKSEDPSVIRLVDVPAPSAFALTRQSFTRTFAVSFLATNIGSTELTSSIKVRDTEGNTRSISARTPVTVVFGGDLLIKKARQPDSEYGLDDVYQRSPAGAQIRTNRVEGPVLDSIFQVIVENDSPTSQTFRLTAVESGPNRGWKVRYLIGGVDVTSSILSPEGHALPEQKESARLGVVIIITATNAVPGDPRRVILALSSAAAPLKTLDAVEAVAELPDVAIPGVELVQVVQDWKNQVPLVAGKPTLMRVFLQEVVPNAATPPVRGVLRAFREDVELPGSPLRPRDKAADVLDREGEFRNEMFGAMNFELPSAWTEGTVKFQFEPVDFRARFREPAEPGGQPADGILIVKFTELPDFPLVLHPTREKLTSGAIATPSMQDMADVIRRLKAMMPVHNIDWRVGFSPSVDTEIIHDAEDLFVINAQIKSDSSYLKCVSLANCEMHQALLPFVAGDRLTVREQGIGLADANPSQVSTATLLFRKELNTTPAHELGHCLGRHHTTSSLFGLFNPGPGWITKEGTCGEVSNVSAPNYPHFYTVDGKTRPYLGPMFVDQAEMVFGYDHEEKVIIDPSDRFDLMSYCDPLWPSKLTYDSLLHSILQRFGVPVASPPPTSPPPLQNLLLVRGMLNDLSNNVRLLPLRTVLASAPVVPSNPGPYQLQLLNNRGELLAAYPFEPSRSDNVPWISSFTFLTPQPANFHRLRILHDTQVLFDKSASAHRPSVQVISPNGGESLNQPEVTIRWSGADADNDGLTYRVEFSADDGQQWTTLAADVAESEIKVPRMLLSATQSGRIRIEASDGFLTGFDESDAVFGSLDNPPVVVIISPSPGRNLSHGERIYFEAAAFDSEEGSLPDASFSWVSNLDGPLRSGRNFDIQAEQLSVGQHTITLTATDREGMTSTAQASLNVTRVSPPTLSQLQLIPDNRLEFKLRSQISETNVVEISRDLQHWTQTLTNVSKLNCELIRMVRPTEDRPVFLRARTW